MIAHINEYGEEQTIKEHLEGTAKRAQTFAQEFGCGDMGKFCGLLHDIGKYSKEFQERIKDPKDTKKVDHSTAGAIEAKNILNGNLLASMIIAGHHSGLLNGGNSKTASANDGTFLGRFKSTIPDYKGWENDITAEKIDIPNFALNATNPVFTTAFLTRMLYSCLVDADYLDTEYFMKQGDVKRGSYDSIEKLLGRFEEHIEGWLKKDDFDNEKHKLLCERRNQILMSCMEKGETFERGIYTLTVPTGGGKTTASLGFALKHINKRKMKRVIYVMPYTSIIDQNSKVFSTILGEQNVLEHHSGVTYEVSDDSIKNEKMYNKVFATENWDSPVVVTTAVQFFESLFASKSSKCRKLHNLANSVIIFDEAQTIPMSYLKPCVAAISELISHYNSTAILCTATQPVLDNYFNEYLPNIKIKEICDNVQELYKFFERTTIVNKGTITKEQLIDEIKGKRQVLCIVNKRKTAREIYFKMPKAARFCLTTLLCPKHRKEKFDEIKHRLENGLPCIVIATSLVEAGVDFDFPEVYREQIGVDSLIQSAGRCNREGKRSVEESKVYLFALENEKSEFFRQNIDALKETLRQYSNPAELEVIAYYFKFYRQLAGEESLDKKGIMDAFLRGIDGSFFPFATVSERFKLIENDTKTIYIPIEEAQTLIDDLYNGKATKETLRKLSDYSVNVYPNHFNKLWESGCLEIIDDTIYILRDMNQYNNKTGLELDVETGFGLFI